MSQDADLSTEEIQKYTNIVSLENSGAYITPTEKQWMLDLAKRLRIPVPVQQAYIAGKMGYNIEGLTVI
jgi:hypothetical protein